MDTALSPDPSPSWEGGTRIGVIFCQKYEQAIRHLVVGAFDAYSQPVDALHGSVYNFTSFQFYEMTTAPALCMPLSILTLKSVAM